MHKHPIALELPFHLGCVKGQIYHRPFDDEYLLVIFTPEILPNFCKIIPRKERLKPREIKVKRSLVESWGGKLIAWSKEPAEASPDTQVQESSTTTDSDAAASA